MQDKDQKLIWENYTEQQNDVESRLNKLRASLKQGELGVVLTDLFRDDPQQVVDDSLPVKVTYAHLELPLVKELEDGTMVPNFLKHWSQEPGERLERVAYGYSIQHALKYNSPVSSDADKIGDKTNVYNTMRTVIVDVDRDASYADNIKHKQALDRSAAADATRWKHD